MGAPVGLGSGLPPTANDGRGSGSAKPRRGKRSDVEVRREKAKQMRASGYSYGEIADALVISRSYAYKLVNGSG